MSNFHALETFFIGICLEGFFWGLYTAMFIIHLQYYIIKEDTGDRKRNNIFYSHCALYFLSGATFAFNFAWFMIQTFELPEKTNLLFYIMVVTNVLYGCCNFLSQSILIYRCWIVWGYNIYVVIIPSILTLAYIPIWLTSTGSESVSNNQLIYAKWARTMVSTSYAIPLAVNALVTGLILLRIVKVYWDVEPVLYEKILSATGKSKFRSIVFALIESAMALFALQVILVVCSGLATEPSIEVGNMIIGTHQMFLGIAPTIIQLRVSMGLSFDGEETMLESPVGTGIRFYASPESSLGVGGIVHQEPESGWDNTDAQDDDYIKEVKR